MPSQQLYTYQDAIDHGIAFLGGDATSNAQRDARTAVLQAYRNLANCHRWNYLSQRGRLATQASYATGTVAYDHTGGAYERMLTLTSGTWPDWAAYGEVVIADIAYEVAERKSSSVVTLSVNANPGADVASGTAYRIQRTTYPLPIDCLALDRMLNASEEDWVWYVHPRVWLERQQLNQTTGRPHLFTIMGDPNYTGTLAVRFYPAPDAIYQMDFVYHRMPRQLRLDSYSTGTVTVSSGATTVTGSGTSWSSAAHAGSVLRFASDAIDIPTGLAGAHPYYRERIITSVTNSTTLEVDQALDETLTGVAYRLSDPVDLEEHAMLTAFQRGIEAELAKGRRMQERGDIIALYFQELRLAQQADSRSTEPRSPGLKPSPYQRLAYYPSGADID